MVVQLMANEDVFPSPLWHSVRRMPILSIIALMTLRKLLVEKRVSMYGSDQRIWIRLCRHRCLTKRCFFSILCQRPVC
jgi:hypothetical protein